MCELLGLAFNKPISPSLSFRGFRHRGERNPDGWGLAAITPTKARITKEPIRADQSTVSQSLRDDQKLAAPIFIGHVRFASRGEANLKNTHPFTRRTNGSEFVFAHNGTLSMEQLNKPRQSRPPRLRPHRAIPQGSECYRQTEPSLLRRAATLRLPRRQRLQRPLLDAP